VQVGAALFLRLLLFGDQGMWSARSFVPLDELV